MSLNWVKRRVRSSRKSRRGCIVSLQNSTTESRELGRPWSSLGPSWTQEFWFPWPLISLDFEPHPPQMAFELLNSSCRFGSLIKKLSHQEARIESPLTCAAAWRGTWRVGVLGAGRPADGSCMVTCTSLTPCLPDFSHKNPSPKVVFDSTKFRLKIIF